MPYEFTRISSRQTKNLLFSNPTKISLPEAILSRIRDNDRDYHVGSTSRKCAAMVGRSLQFLNQFIWCVADAIQNIAEISSLVARGVKLILDEDLVESKYLLCKRSIRYGTTRANMFSTGASSE